MGFTQKDLGMAYGMAFKAACDIAASAGVDEYATNAEFAQAVRALADELVTQALEGQLWVQEHFKDHIVEEPKRSSGGRSNYSGNRGSSRPSSGSGGGTYPASEKQLSFLESLLAQREHDLGEISLDGLDKKRAGELIEQLLAAPEKPF